MMVSCGRRIPEEYDSTERFPCIYPDYVGVTVPVNIAPLTFQIDGDPSADEITACFRLGDIEEVWGGRSVQPDMKEWRLLLQQARGKDLEVDVYVRHEKKWTRYRPFKIHVAPDSIDAYLTYRLIPPSYVAYEKLTIRQRCLEDYDENVVYSNMLGSTNRRGQCVNCHSYQNWNANRMQFHARQNNGGTMIVYDGKLQKIDLKTDSVLSSGVYPAWHPWLKFIVYSTNLTHQSFHTADANKIEVFDTGSDLVAYDIEHNTVTNIEKSDHELEVFPSWAPDGRTLYFASAHFERRDTSSVTEDADREHVIRYRDVKYNLYKKSFDPETKIFGPRQLVFDASQTGKSATLPRVSPDGKWLLFTMATYGVFHIWHRDADLWMMNLKSGEVRNMVAWNTDETESYHSWSSNGRWAVISSRRDDGNYTRPFIAYFDSVGKGAKPFELPTSDPNRHRLLLKSYNVPELSRNKVEYQPKNFAEILKKKAVRVKYQSKYNN